MLALTAALIAASPAVARQSVTYAGEAFFRSYSSRGGLPPGGLTGVHSYSAVFRYDDSLALLSAGFSVDGVTRESFICPLAPACVDLSTSVVHVGSTVATTPEDGVEASVHSPSMFGGRPLFGPARRIYDVLPDDDSSAFLTFALFDRPGYGFAYSYGIGSVSQVVTGVPEPSSWALMIAGFGTIGLAARRRIAGAGTVRRWNARTGCRGIRAPLAIRNFLRGLRSPFIFAQRLRRYSPAKEGFRP